MRNIKYNNFNINMNIKFIMLINTTPDNSFSIWAERKSKRKYSNSPRVPQNNNNKLFSIKNWFKILSPMQTPDELLMKTLVLNSALISNKLPSPIFIRNELDYASLYTELIELIGIDNFHNKSNDDCQRIQTSCPE